MKTLRIAAASLAGFLAVAGAWYVNGWDYESAYSRGLLDGARVGFVKGHQNARRQLNEQSELAPVIALQNADPA